MINLKLKFGSLIFIFFILSMPNFSLAAINFIDGKWETTFDCEEQSQIDGFNCDGLGAAGGWTCSGSASFADLITSGANYPLGAGGKGFRHFEGDGTNNNGGGISLEFPSAQKELWIRSYLRYNSGFTWAYLPPHYDKLFYIHTGAPGYDAIAGLEPSSSGKFGVVGQSAPIGTPFVPTKGWNDVYPLEVADGAWFAFEIYIKMNNPNQNDGVARVWLNGEMTGENNSYNWSGVDLTATEGWISILIGSNQNEPRQGDCIGVDFDDIVIYNYTPPNLDANGNSFIGPIGWVNGEDNIPPSSPTGLNVL